MIERDCIICNKTFSVPFGRRDVVTTCCKYCQSLALAWKKNQGRYLLCKMCDKPIWTMPSRQHKYCSKKCHNLAMSVFPDEMNLDVIQTGRKKYYGSNWLSQRRKARERDNFTCQKCGITEKEYGQELSVHHKTPFVYFETYLKANRLENLISVCEPCHRKIHSGENHTINYKKEKIIFNKDLNTVQTKQRESALKVLDLLLNTDKTLKEISQLTGVSYSKVQKLYRGKSWTELYEIPPRDVRPRAKGLKKAKEVYSLLISTNLTLTEISKRTN
ncbi:HNH endonuclease, partial [Butyricicoccus sp. 1XD8-22]